MKKRLLIMSDCYNVFTGFSNIARHVSNHLHATGKWDIAYLGWFHAPINNIVPPFTYYTTLKDHGGCCKRGNVVMRCDPDGKFTYYDVNQGVIIPKNGGPNCLGGRLLEHDKYGFQSMHGIILDWKPDVIWTLGDTWMVYHTGHMGLRPSYKWVSYVPIDGTPMPKVTEMGGQYIDWVDTLKRADIPVSYCDFGKKAMIDTAKKYGENLNTVRVVYHGNDNETFHPVPEKRGEFKKKWYNVEPEVFFIGCFSRNQPRKAFHKLIEAISLGKKKGYWNSKTLRCRFHAPVKDVGWNLPGLVKWHDVEDIIILDHNLKVGEGPTDQEMNELYNACDLMTLPSRGEGWGLTYSEAMAAGVPVLMSAYSAHHDWAKGAAARIKPAALDAEPITNIERAVVDVEDYCEKIKAFYDNITIGQYIEKFGVLKDWSGAAYPPIRGAETPIREYFSKEGRELCEKYLSWPTICQQWEKILDEVDTSKNLPYPQVRLPKQVNLQDLLEKEKKDRMLFVLPGTFGDVFLSTAVIEGLKKKYPQLDIYYATSPAFKGILDGNKNIFKVLDFDPIFTNTNVMNQLFEIVFTPAIETQASNNWTKNGHGDHLVNIYAKHCGVGLEGVKPFVQIVAFQDKPEEPYMVIHTKTGQEPKNWLYYQKIVDRLNIKVVQVGAKEDQLLKNVTDCRGRTIQETAGIIREAKAFVGGDSICAHLAGYCKTPSLLIYSSTFPSLTKYPFNDYPCIIAEPENRFGCDRPCHLAQCFRGVRSCIDTVHYNTILENIKAKFGIELKPAPAPTISGYTTLYNPNKYYPWRQCIKSMLGFCNEVVIVDGGSTDGTWEELKEWKTKEPKLKIYKRKWREDEPSMDGMQKAYARALCTKEYCWQMDADEIVHESDYPKIFKIIEEMNPTVKILTLPVLDLYGSNKTVRTDRGLYKWRISVNSPEITHGIPKQLRKTNKEGKIYCDPNLCDGCFPINAKTGDMVDHQVTFVDQALMEDMLKNPQSYADKMRKFYKDLPSVWHYSWHDLERRIHLDLDFWDKQWAILAQDKRPPNRFIGELKPGETITDELIKQKAEFYKDKKLDGTLMPLISIDWLDQPAVMRE